MAIRPFIGIKSDHLSFPINARIVIIRKDMDMWKGRYDGRVGWFPHDYVQEINNEATSSEHSTLSYETIELAGLSFERVMNF